MCSECGQPIENNEGVEINHPPKGWPRRYVHIGDCFKKWFERKGK